MIYLPQRYTIHNKPPYGSRIDAQHPISQGLVGALLFNEGARGPYDMFSHLEQTNAIGTWERGRLRAAWSGTNAQSSAWNFTTAPWTVCVAANIAGTQANTDNYTVFGRTRFVDNSNNQGWAITSDNSGASSPRWRYLTNANNSSYNLFGVAGMRFAGDWFLAIVVTSTARTGYAGLIGRNLIAEASDANNLSQASNTTTGLSASNNAGATISNYAAYGWRRALSFNELRQLCFDPFCIVEPPFFVSPEAAAASTFKPAWAYRCNQLIGRGAL